MRRKLGFTLVEIMIVVAIIALLTAIAIPAFLQYRKDARRSLCVNNLRLIDHAKEVLAIKLGWTSMQVIATAEPLGDGPVTWSNLNPYIDGTNALECPENKSATATPNYYHVNPIDVCPTCPVWSATGLFTEHIYEPD